MSMRTWTVPVAGMTCRSCETRVARKLVKLDGVREVTVDARGGRARIVARRMPSNAAIESAVRAAGYRVGTESRPWLSRDPRVWRRVGIGLVVVLVLFGVVKLTGLDTAVSRTGALDPSSLGVVVLIGLAAGFSTCLALVGGLVLAVAARYSQQHPDAGAGARLRPLLAFNAGRVIGFAAFGAVLGAVGSVLTFSDRILGVLLLLAATVLVVLGIRLTGASPRLAATGFTLPPALARILRIEGRERRRYTDRNAAVLGALTFFLPCGFTQTVQVFALSTGRPATAAAVMALFALGTLPGLLGLGGVTAFVRGPAAQTFFAVAGVVVLAFALVNARGGFTDLGVTFGGGSGTPSAAEPVSGNVKLLSGVQELTVTQDADGYSPDRSVVYAGTPVRWVVNSTAPLSCSAALRAPDIGVRASLHEGKNVFNFTPTETGVIEYHCAMGMYSAKIAVVDRPLPPAPSAGAPAQAAQPG